MGNMFSHYFEFTIVLAKMSTSEQFFQIFKSLEWLRQFKFKDKITWWLEFGELYKMKLKKCIQWKIINTVITCVIMCNKKNQLIGIKIRMNKSIQLNSKLSDHFFIGYRAH